MTPLLATRITAAEHSPAGDRACEQMEVSARAFAHWLAASTEANIQADADRMFNERWRLPWAVYGLNACPAWPMLDKTAGDVLADCQRLLANMRGLKEAGHYAYDKLRCEALESAERALVRIVATEGATS